jgi:hypothetical protein
MKMKNVFRIFLLAALVMFSHIQLKAQPEKQQKKIEEAASLTTAIDAQHYIFIAQSMIPMSGFSRQLGGGYDLAISNDAVVSFLPYMGRIYMPPMDPAQAPLRFTSSDFTYNAERTRKNGWNISIKPKDVNSVREMNLSISDGGAATLQVNGNDRQPITFYGYVVENA